MSGGIREVLTGIVGADAVLSDLEAGGLEHSQGPGESQPLVVAPVDEAQVAAVLERASREGWRVLPSGGGTPRPIGLSKPVDIIVTAQRLTTIHEYEPADLTFTAGAGLSMMDLSETTEPHKQWLPLDPPGGADSTLGGVVSMALPGPLRHLYGTARDHVLGLTLVSGDGRVLRWGGRVVKNVAGFDVTRLATGSWGTLGMITSVSARLFPVPQIDRSLVFSGPTMAPLVEAGLAMAQSPLPLAAIELLDHEPVGPGAHGKKGTEAPGLLTSGALALRLMGTEDQVEEMDRRIRNDLSPDLGEPTAYEGEKSRALHVDLQRWETGADLLVRLSLLPAALPELLDIIRRHLALNDGDQPGGAKASGAEPVIRATAHVGSGIVRVGAWGLEPDLETVAAWGAAICRARPEVEARDGSVRVSAGPSALRQRLDPWGSSGPGLPLARRLKSVFDPEGIMAPGHLGL